MTTTGRSTRRRGGLGLLGIGTVLAAWAIVARLQLVPELFLPAPRSVATAAWEMAVTGYRGATLLGHVAYSLGRLLAGFALAAVTAIPLGLAMGFSDRIRRVLDPLIELYRPLPPLAYYTLLIVWLGIGEASKIVLLYLAAVPPIVLNTAGAVAMVGRRRIESAEALGANRRVILLRIIVPSILPGIFTGLRVAIGFAYTTLVSAEIVAATEGIGWVVLDAGRFLRTDVIFVAIFVMAGTGWALDRLLRTAEQICIPWRGHV